MYLTSNAQKSVNLGRRLEDAWNKELKKEKPSLMWALFKVFRCEIMVYAVYNTVADFIKIMQPILISQLVTYIQSNKRGEYQQEIYICASLLILASLFLVVGLHHYQMLVMTMGMKVRVAACALIYRKALKLNKTALAETTIGQMVNLLSNDVGRFEYSCQLMHTLWLAPLETIVVMVMLYFYVGPTGLVGCAFLLLFIPFQIYVAKLTSKFRLKTALRTDERVRLMNEIIAGVQVIKMYTWEKPFAKLVEIVRKREVTAIGHMSNIRAIMMSCTMTLSRIAIFLCVLTYVFTGNTLTASYAFTITSFYSFLRQTVTMFFPQAITQFAETRVSVTRIQKFMMYPELIKEDEDSNYNNITISSNGNSKLSITEKQEISIKLKHVAVKWIKSSTENNLQNINFEAHSNQLVALVGPVGGGKSTLLHVILKELEPIFGSVSVSGSISYASQEPWVFGGSIRQNILFGQEYNEKRYQEVISVCALERDFSLLPHGDRTLVGERGATLSGGQRARINLARAVYKESDIYLLDDPLSAVDTHVGKQLYRSCIAGYLKNKCVILVTHQLQYLRTANCIYLLVDGVVRASGTYQTLKNSENAFTNLLESSKEDEKKDILRRMSRSESIQSQMNEYDEAEDEGAIEQQKEERASGSVSKKVYVSYLKAAGHWTKTLALSLLFIFTQTFASLTDIFLTTWVNTEQLRNETNFNNTMNSNTTSTQHFLLRLLNRDNTLIIYSCLVLLTVSFAITRSLSFFRFCLSASTRLHNAMFGKIVFSPMLFFNTNPSGRILNRFSKDIGSLDETLPICIVDTVGIGLIAAGITLTIGTVNPWILIPAAILMIIFYYIRKLFLTSSRNIKRVEAVARSPIYTHLSASLQGLTTIRAFRAEEILSKEFDNFQDAYTSAYYMFLTANRGFGFWLDMHCLVLIIFVVISILFIQGESFGGNVGLSLTQAVALSGMVQWGMRQWSELENQMTSVERVQEYADLPVEPDVHKRDPPSNWPSLGNVKFENVSLKYAEDGEYVLKNLNFEIQPKEKIGIVGRTGAGKSSLIQAVFRLAQIEGSIFVDGIDSKDVQLRILRSKISIIPQEPVLFSGTLRKNLDPFDEYRDEILWDALDEVELKHAVNELSAGLDSKMAEGGSNFSVGQRQLVCLARAIVRNNKILVLDEATANVDPLTDAIIQNTIREKFENCTVLTIAHRLHTIMDSDKVLVMDAGQAVEFDHPHVLLQKKGVFHSLVRQTGSVMAASLQAIAAENFEKNPH